MKIDTFMKNITWLAVFVLFFACTESSQSSKEELLPADSTNTATRQLRHMVIFKFTDSASSENIEATHQAFLELESSIPVIKDFEWGLNNSPENLHQDFTHCYLITFESAYDRDSVYLPHPEHLKFVEGLQPHLEKAFVIDYWVN